MASTITTAPRSASTCGLTSTSWGSSKRAVAEAILSSLTCIILLLCGRMREVGRDERSGAGQPWCRRPARPVGEHALQAVELAEGRGFLAGPRPVGLAVGTHLVV